MTSTLLLLWLSVGSPGCSLPTLDEVASLPTLEQGFAWEVVSEACAHALPQRLVQGLRQYPAAPASQAAQIVAELIHEDPARWQVLCPSGKQAFAASISWPDDKARRFDACGWQALGLGTREEFATANAPELAVMVFHALVHDARLDVTRARRFARAIGGLSAPPPPVPPPAPAAPQADRPGTFPSGGVVGGTIGGPVWEPKSREAPPQKRLGRGGLGLGDHRDGG